MTKNQWIERQQAEDEALEMVLDHMIHFCYEAFTKDPTPPTNDDIDAVVAEAVQVYKDAIEDI